MKISAVAHSLFEMKKDTEKFVKDCNLKSSDLESIKNIVDKEYPPNKQSAPLQNALNQQIAPVQTVKKVETSKTTN